MKTRPIAANAAFVTQRLRKRLSQRNATILDRMMRVHFQIAPASQLQIHHSVFREQHEHVVKKRNAGFEGRFALAIEIQARGDAGFFGVTSDAGLPGFHGGIKSKLLLEDKAQLRRLCLGSGSL